MIQKNLRSKAPKTKQYAFFFSSDCIKIVLRGIEPTYIILRNIDSEIKFFIFSLLTQPLPTGENIHYVVSENGKSVFH